MNKEATGKQTKLSNGSAPAFALATLCKDKHDFKQAMLHFGTADPNSTSNPKLSSLRKNMTNVCLFLTPTLCRSLI